MSPPAGPGHVAITSLQQPPVHFNHDAVAKMGRCGFGWWGCGAGNSVRGPVAGQRVQEGRGGGRRSIAAFVHGWRSAGAVRATAGCTLLWPRHAHPLPAFCSGMSAVVRAGVRKADGAPCAIKIISKDNLDVDTAMVRNEIEVMKSLDHPAIVHLLDYKETSRRLYIITERAFGGEVGVCVLPRVCKGSLARARDSLALRGTAVRPHCEEGTLLRTRCTAALQTYRRRIGAPAPHGARTAGGA